MTQNNGAIFLLTDDQGQQMPVDRELILGREATCDLVLDKGKASRRHARLSPADDGLWVEDLGSTNGTFVNGARIAERTLLRAGDELRGGDSVFRVEVLETANAQDSDATLLYSADADSTLQEAAPIAAVTAEPKVEASQAKARANQSAAQSDSKAPPSWVLNNQQSVDGTAFISKDAIKNSLANSSTKLQAQEEVTEPTLIGNSDPVMGLRFQLIGDKNKWEVGRSPNADVMLNDDSVSGSHAQVLCENGRWKLVDLMSANGTYTNGKKCLTGYLAIGDVLRFGAVECVFALPAGAAAYVAETNDDDEPAAGASPIKVAIIAFAVTAVVIGGVVAAITML